MQSDLARHLLSNARGLHKRHLLQVMLNQNTDHKHELSVFKFGGLHPLTVGGASPKSYDLSYTSIAI